MKTLIVFASKYGTTKKCAVELKKHLEGEVSLWNLQTEKVVEMKDYDQIIIGGSVYMGKIRKEVTNFMKKNASILKEKRIGLFICCMRENELAEAEIVSVFPKELVDVAVVKDYFGGEFNFEKMNFFEKLIVKMVAKADKLELDSSGLTSLIKLERIKNFADHINKK